MKLFKYKTNKDKADVRVWFRQAAEENPRTEEIVRAIGTLVRQEGDQALLKLMSLSDPKVSAAVRTEGASALLTLLKKMKVDPEQIAGLRASARDKEEARNQVPARVMEALQRAQENIRKFHQKQVRGSWQNRTGGPRDGMMLGQLYNPVDIAGLYVPTGQAPLVSTVLMTAVPAEVAGVRKRVLCCPAGRDGRIDPFVLATAELCGVQDVFGVGGAQAIFAMAYGTETIPRVDVIAGPGNIYVAAALRMVQGSGAAGVESIPGPSEVMIVADDSADPKCVAMDLCSQAEHDEEAMSVLVSLSRELTKKVLAELKKLVRTLSRRSIVETSLERRGAVIEAGSVPEALELVDLMAPEHLEVILAEDSEGFSFSVKNAGMILIGPWTPVAVSDYYAGPSHVLPTGGTARFASGITVDTFTKRSSLVSYTEAALKNEAPYLTELIQLEGLTAHLESVRMRVKNKEKS